MPETSIHLYTSENGDRWWLCRAADGSSEVLHMPNASCGGEPSRTGVAEFLATGRNGPEHQALRVLVADTLAVA
jgi:hypothetical protein